MFEVLRGNNKYKVSGADLEKKRIFNWQLLFMSGLTAAVQVGPPLPSTLIHLCRG